MIRKEEAIKIFQDKIKTMEDGAICCNYGIDKDAFIFAIQAIQAFQTPCDDAISRQAVLDEINRVAVKAFETYDDYSNFYDFVAELPPYTSLKRMIGGVEDNG